MIALTKWVPIFRTGTHTDSQGRVQNYTQRHLDTMIVQHRNKTEDSPLVLGHPKDADPAFGWMENLKREGEILFAQFASVPDEIAEAVHNKLYKYVSVSHDKDLRIRHVGLLGAVAPGVKGLGEVQFAEDANAVVINFSDAGEEPAEEPMDPKELQAQIDTLKKEIESLKTQLADAQTERKQAEEALKAKASEFAEHVAKQRKDALETRIDALIESGRVLPAKKSEVLAFCEALDNGAEVSFSEGGGKKSLVEHYLHDLESQDNGLLREFSAPFDAPEAAPEFDPDALARKF